MAEDKGNEDIQALRNEIKRLRLSLPELTPSLETLLRHRGFRIYKKAPSPPPVLRLEKELFQIWNRTFIINARDSITNNTGNALSWYFGTGRKAPCPLNA